MSTDFNPLKRIVEQISDEAKRQRLIVKWTDESIDVLDRQATQVMLANLLKRSDNPQPTPKYRSEDSLLTSKEACRYLGIGMTTFIDWKAAGIVQIADQVMNRHLFSQIHLDNVRNIPAEKKNTVLTDYRSNKGPSLREKKALKYQLRTHTLKRKVA